MLTISALLYIIIFSGAVLASTGGFQSFYCKQVSCDLNSANFKCKNTFRESKNCFCRICFLASCCLIASTVRFQSVRTKRPNVIFRTALYLTPQRIKLRFSRDMIDDFCDNFIINLKIQLSISLQKILRLPFGQGFDSPQLHQLKNHLKGGFLIGEYVRRDSKGGGLAEAEPGQRNLSVDKYP